MEIYVCFNMNYLFKKMPSIFPDKGHNTNNNVIDKK